MGPRAGLDERKISSPPGFDPGPNPHSSSTTLILTSTPTLPSGGIQDLLAKVMNMDFIDVNSNFNLSN